MRVQSTARASSVLPEIAITFWK